MPKALGYEKIIDYENFLVKFLTKEGVQKEVGYILLLKFIG